MNGDSPSLPADVPQGGSVPPATHQPPGFRLLSEMVSKPIDWLWHLRIPRGELSLVDGDPSTNKSSLVLDLAARVSSGQMMPGESETRQGGVLLLLAEDSLEKTILRRLETAEADLSRMAVLTR